MKEVLEETHGVMVYQEQVMRILNRLGGIKLANAYSCIKAISKKKLDTIAKFREEFVEGAHAQGMSKKEAAELFGLIEKFAGYGFNKSHSDRLRPDRLHDRLPEGALQSRVHGGAACRATSPGGTSNARIRWSSISKTASGWTSPCCRPT